MSDKQSNLTDKEIEDLQNIVANTLASICVMADRHNIDRDSMLKYFADMLTVFTEVANIQNYETNHANADRIRNMSDGELAELLITFKNTFGEEYEGEVSCMDWLQSEAKEIATNMENLDVRR
jgi:hypothetical protein